MLNIVSEKNCFIEEIEKAYDRGYKIYISGGGSSARGIYNFVLNGEGRHIPLEAFVLNDSYYDAVGMKMMEGVPVIPLRELNLNDPNIFLCIGYMHYDFYDSELKAPKGMKGIFFNEDVTFLFDKTEKLDGFVEFLKEQTVKTWVKNNPTRRKKQTKIICLQIMKKRGFTCFDTAWMYCAFANYRTSEKCCRTFQQ